MNALEASIDPTCDAVPGVGAQPDLLNERAPLRHPAECWMSYCFPEQLVGATRGIAARAGFSRGLAPSVLDFADDRLPLAHFASAMQRASLELAAHPWITLAYTENRRAAVVWWNDAA